MMYFKEKFDVFIYHLTEIPQVYPKQLKFSILFKSECMIYWNKPGVYLLVRWLHENNIISEDNIPFRISYY
jgi:hypothetical protein